MPQGALLERLRVGRAVRAQPLSHVEISGYEMCLRYRNSLMYQARTPQRRPAIAQAAPNFRRIVVVKVTWLGKANRSGDSVKNANIDPPQTRRPRTTTKWTTPRRRRRSHQRCMRSDQYQANLAAIRAP